MWRFYLTIYAPVSTLPHGIYIYPYYLPVHVRSTWSWLWVVAWLTVLTETSRISVCFSSEWATRVTQKKTWNYLIPTDIPDQLWLAAVEEYNLHHQKVRVWCTSAWKVTSTTMRRSSGTLLSRIYPKDLQSVIASMLDLVRNLVMWWFFYQVVVIGTQSASFLPKNREGCPWLAHNLPITLMLAATKPSLCHTYLELHHHNWTD